MTGWELDRGEDAGGESPVGKRRGGGGNRLDPVLHMVECHTAQDMYYTKHGVMLCILQ